LLLDVFHVVSRLRRGEHEHPVPPEDLARFVPTLEEHGPGRPDGREILEFVARSGKVPPEQLRLISDAVLDRIPVSVAARQAGLSVKAMTCVLKRSLQRRWRTLVMVSSSRGSVEVWC